MAADPSELPPCACRGELMGAELYIIGTAHISARSAADVEELISRIQPDSIVVELSRNRISSLYPAGATQTQTGSLQLNVGTTEEGFPVILRHIEPQNGADGQLIICNAEGVEEDVVNMRQPISSFRDGKWLETAFEKHRYRSETLKVWPAIELMATLSNRLFPLAQRAFYMSVGTVRHSGGEFAAAARQGRSLNCPIVLGDVENEDLFDPLGALEVTREDPFWVRLAGPLVRPSDGGIDLWKALKHVFAGTTKPGAGAAIGAVYLALLIWGFWSDEVSQSLHATVDLSSVPPLLLAMSATNTFIASVIIFLLTATRDEQLYRALREAARTTVAKQGHGKVVMVCGVAHVNGIARHVAKARAAGP
ncbi:unnamed protein product [Effrenium voratum]|uniref:TraB family protein n=1 Tax=Effrenium voratum TaxID=2562239 RepID=A0AA36MLP8_9DINO|nr:unnamed protein product [Effrenium voratum]CAJ1431213.1 unnamed protein product [Effrenium voratum]